MTGKLLKKLLLVLLIVSFVFASAGCYLISNTLVLYNTNGETIEIREDKFEEYEEKGWYDHPVTIVYNESGENRIVPTEELTDYNSDGWYTVDQKVTVYYSDGRQKEVSYKDYAGYIRDGWFDYPVNYKNDYATVLYDYINNNNIVYDSAFNLIHIDDDGIPELVIRNNTSHAAGVNVYTYKNGKVIEQHWFDENGEKFSGFGSFGDMEYNPKKGTFISHYSGMGHVMISVYSLSDTGEVSPILNTHGTIADPLQAESYEVNGKTVSRSDYINALKPYGLSEYSEPDGVIAESAFGNDGYLLSDSEIKKVLGY